MFSAFVSGSPAYLVTNLALPVLTYPADIFRSEGMASFASSLPTIDSRSANAAQDIDLSRYDFEMGGVDAWGISAQMIQFQPLRDRFDE